MLSVTKYDWDFFHMTSVITRSWYLDLAQDFCSALGNGLVTTEVTDRLLYNTKSLKLKCIWNVNTIDTATSKRKFFIFHLVSLIEASKRFDLSTWCTMTIIKLQQSTPNVPIFIVGSCSRHSSIWLKLIHKTTSKSNTTCSNMQFISEICQIFCWNWHSMHGQ